MGTRADAVIVFVHGIGLQPEGSTLREGVDCLVRSLDADEFDGPTVNGIHTRRLVWTDSRKRRRSGICAEGWWDRIVSDAQASEPTWKTWLWLLAVSATVLTASASLRAFAVDLDSPGLIAKARAIAKLVAAPLAYVVVLVPLIPALLTGAAIWLLVERGAARWSNGSTPLTRALRGYAGDARAFSTSASRDSVIDHLDAVAATLAPHGRRTVIVGHSQGGAFSRSVCTDRFPKRSLVTVGSGANLLAISRATRGWKYAIGWLQIVTFPFFLAWGFDQVWAEGETLWSPLETMAHRSADALKASDPDTQLFAFSNSLEDFSHALFAVSFGPLERVMLAMVAVISLVLFLRRRRPAQTPDEIATPTGRWVDISSPYDPVCAGAFGLEDSAQSVAIVNARRRRDLWSEHMNYFSNPDVGRLIGAVATDQPSPTDLSGEAIRIGLLGRCLIWLCLVLAAICVVLAWHVVAGWVFL